MFAPSDIDGHHALEHPARALDRIHRRPTGCCCATPAAHGDDDVDAALVGRGATRLVVPINDHGEAWRENRAHRKC